MSISLPSALGSKFRLFVLLFGGLVYFSLPIAASAAEPASPPPGSTLEQRIAQRKQERQITLDTQATTRTQQQCRGSQPKISLVVQATDKLDTARTATYQKIDAKLLIASGKLKLAEKDTFTLERKRNEYLAKVTTFRQTIDEFRQTLDDAAVINCQADPVGFRSLLETARLYNTRLKTQSKEINSLIVDSIKPMIDDFASQLEPKSTTKTTTKVQE